MGYASAPLNTNFATIRHAKERKAAGRHEGGRQADRPGPGPDKADAPEQMASQLADLRDVVLCRGSGHQGPGVRLRLG